MYSELRMGYVSVTNRQGYPGGYILKRSLKIAQSFAHLGVAVKNKTSENVSRLHGAGPQAILKDLGASQSQTLLTPSFSVELAGLDRCVFSKAVLYVDGSSQLLSDSLFRASAERMPAALVCRRCK